MLARSLVQDWMSTGPDLSNEPFPSTSDIRVRTVAAGLVELFAERFGQRPPHWTADVGPLPEPLHLLRAAATMSRLRRLCEEQSPYPLKKRGLFAPPEFLSFA